MKITFAGPTFFGQSDEDLFFSALYALPAYQSVVGEGPDLHLELRDPVDPETIERLKAVLRRWAIDIEPLRSLNQVQASP